ncbi:hypothetical protein KKH43_06210 [Patescibacteria group bacterium]|nr:hypothetical protein [Patescibacteria group bacterium]
MLQEVGPGLIELWGYISLVISYTWFILIPLFLYLGFQLFLFRRQIKFALSIDYDLIAITIPADNIKDPKSMEQIITAIHSIEHPPNMYEKYWYGEFQLSVSLEIVGINGQVRFLMRMPNKYRESLEAMIYAYYPEAEIMLVEDYVTFAPDTYPNEEYDMYGTEIALVRPDPYPIRTYKSFAEDIEKGFIDPVSTLTEAMSGLNPGEQLWFQIIIQPRWDEKWQKKALAVVDELMNRSPKSSESWVSRYVLGGWHNVEKNIDNALGFPPSEIEDEEGMEMSFLSPGEREVIKAIEESISKIAFFVKMRFVYVGKNEVFNKPKGMMPMFMFMRIFTTENLNGLKPNTKNWTSVDYFKKMRVPRRKRLIMKGFKGRDPWMGGNAYVMSTEEIATMYHFPYESVRTPTLERLDTRKAEPPPDLPVPM